MIYQLRRAREATEGLVVTTPPHPIRNRPGTACATARQSPQVGWAGTTAVGRLATDLRLHLLHAVGGPAAVALAMTRGTTDRWRTRVLYGCESAVTAGSCVV